MVFEWDKQKDKQNQKKHGIAFSEAAGVFSDPKLLVIPDPFEDEERWDAIGLVGKVLFVVYTERDADTVRIISARKANKKEIDGYQKNDFRRS